jgi:SAM-dependent methyltransferase
MMNAFDEASPRLTHDLMAQPSHDELTEQLFVRDLKLYVMGQLEPRQKEIALAEAAALDRRTTNDAVGSVRRKMEGRASFGAWLAMKRESQRMLWSAVGDSVERQADRLAALADIPDPRGSVTIDPDFAVPDYIAMADVHLMPGGYGLDDGSLLQGAVMDRGGAVYMLGRNGGMLNDLRGQTALAHVLTRMPDIQPLHILDMGCGVGTSAVPAAMCFPDAEVTAIDVGASMLRYAHARAENLGARVHFSQQNAESTTFEPASFDIVYSCALLHETSPQAVQTILAESRRLLRSGGIAVHLEVPLLHSSEDLWSELSDELEAQYNNEPNWRGALSADYGSLMREAGFHDVVTGYQATAFNARGGPHHFGQSSEGVFRSWFVTSGRA